MAFDIFPDPATAALLGKPPFAPLGLAPGERMSAFAPLPSLVGPDPAQPGLTVTYVRIVVSSAATAATKLAVELSAADPEADPDKTRLVDSASASGIGNSVPLLDSVNTTSAAHAYFDAIEGGVFLLKIAIEIPGAQIRFRLANNNAVASNIVWVVADSDGDSRQPWINLAAAQGAGADVAVAVASFVGQPFEWNAVDLILQNFGSGPSTVAAFSPPLPAPYAVRGLPLQIAPNQTSRHDVKIGADRPAFGALAPAVFRLTTRDKADPGPRGPLHNDGVTLSGRTELANIWTPCASMSIGRTGLAAAADATGAALYAFGGLDSDGTPVTPVERYDIAGNIWTGVGDMPTARTGFAVALGGDGWIYVMGGSVASGGADPSLNEAFNPATGQWRTLKPMTSHRNAPVLAAGADGLIYAIGGMMRTPEGPRFLRLVEAYDPKTDTWLPREPIPRARGAACAATTDGSVIYVAGGDNSFSIFKNVDAFDIASGTWSERKPMLTARKGFGLAASRNGKLYAAGGVDAAFHPIPQAEEFDPAVNEWTQRADLGFPREALALAGGATGRVYAIGGNAQDFKLVETFAP